MDSRSFAQQDTYHALTLQRILGREGSFVEAQPIRLELAPDLLLRGKVEIGPQAPRLVAAALKVGHLLQPNESGDGTLGIGDRAVGIRDWAVGVA